MKDNGLTDEERERFNSNFDALKDVVDPSGNVDRRAIPADSNPSDLPAGVVRTIAQMNGDQIQLLVDLAKAGESHIFLYDHTGDTRKRGKVIAMGL